MRDFCKFPVSFWASSLAKVIRKIGPNNLLIATYLQSNTHSNMIGVYHLPLEYIAIDTGIPLTEIHNVINTLQEVNFCHYDVEHEYVWVLDFAAKQTGENLCKSDKRVVAIHKLFANLPQLCFIDAFYKKYQDHYHLRDPYSEIDHGYIAASSA